jgi:hypothetical protein
MDNLAYLDEEEGALLPARKTMLTIVLPTVEVAAVAGVNLALSLNAATIGATATSIAMQTLSVNL